MRWTNARPSPFARAARHCRRRSPVVVRMNARVLLHWNRPTQRFERARSTVSIGSSVIEHSSDRLPSANAAFRHLRAELAAAAYRTCRVTGNANVAPLHRQCVDNQQTSCERFTNSGEQFEGFAGLRRADDADERRKHAHRRAPGFLQLVAFSEQTV